MKILRQHVDIYYMHIVAECGITVDVFIITF